VPLHQVACAFQVGYSHGLWCDFKLKVPLEWV
jgi:hypothetical protein